MKTPRVITKPAEIRKMPAGNNREIMLPPQDANGDLFVEQVIGTPGSVVGLHVLHTKMNSG